MDLPIDINLILYFLLALLVIAVAGLLALLFLMTRWRKHTEEALLQLGSEINNIGMQIENLQAVQQEYSSLHRQPYTDLAAELQKKIGRVLADAQTLDQHWEELNDAHTRVPVSRFQALIDSIPTAYRNARAAAAMWQERERIQRQLAEAQALSKRIETLPGEVHAQARQLGEGIIQLEGLLKTLHEAGLHGKQVEAADDALLRLQQGWMRIPTDFTATRPPDGQISEVREVTSSVYTVLNDLQPVLDEWLPRAQTWDQQYKRTVDSYEEMRKTATNFRSALETPPVGLVVDSFHAELEKVRATAKALNRRLQEPLVEDLRSLERDTAHLARVILDAAGRYDRVALQVAELDRTLLELESQLKAAGARLAEPEKLQVSPLQWDISRPALAALEEKAAALGGREQMRTPEQVASAARQAAALLEEVRAFEKGTEQVLSLHHDLLALMGSGAITGGAAFSAEVKELARSVQAYDPANWPSQENIAALPKQAAQLEDLQRRLSAPRQTAAVKESLLGARLEEAAQLVELHNALRARVERIGKRLAELQQAEEDAADELERAIATADSLALLVKDNPLLRESASAELTRTQAELARLKQEFDNPAQGVVERKVSRANALLDGFSRAASTWLEKLAADLQVHTRKISETLAALEPVAALDDRAVADARALLNRVGAGPLGRKTAMNYLDAAAELKRWNNDWQACSSAARALEALAGPVLDAYKEADQARKAAKAAFQAAGKLASGRRDWPPTRQSLADEVKIFQSQEARLDGLRARRIASGALVRELGQIYHELDLLEDRVSTATRAAEAEQREAAEAEQAVVTLQQRWQAVAQRYPGQADLDLEIKDLISQADQRLALLKNQYRRGGMEYDQVLSALREQAGILRSARFTTAAGQSITLSE